jgi:hypothetical protein
MEDKQNESENNNECDNSNKSNVPLSELEI